MLSRVMSLHETEPPSPPTALEGILQSRRSLLIFNCLGVDAKQEAQEKYFRSPAYQIHAAFLEFSNLFQ